MGSQSEKPWCFACIRQLEVGSRCIIILLACILLFAGCPDSQRVGMDPPSMSGEYSGTYRVTYHLGESPRQVINQNYILWTFDEPYFYFRIDPALHTGYCFCRVHGEYALTEGLRLLPKVVTPDSALGCWLCDESEVPVGVFVRESKGDTMIFRLQEAATYKELKLIRTGAASASQGQIM